MAELPNSPLFVDLARDGFSVGAGWGSFNHPVHTVISDSYLFAENHGDFGISICGKKRA